MDTVSPPTTVVGPVIVQLLQLSALAEVELAATQQFGFGGVPFLEFPYDPPEWRLAKVVFNGCVSTTWTALGVPFGPDVLHELPTVNP